jgi:glycosyltransferase 2 family protein
VPGTPLAVERGVRHLRLVLLVAGLATLVGLIHHVGPEAVALGLARIAWWEFALICAMHGVSVIIDTLGWSYTFAGDRPAFHRLLATLCAGEAVNVVTALGSVGGEATKAWLLRREIPYEASVPTLVLAKTTLVLAQALLLGVGIVMAWTTGAGGPAVLVAMASLLVVEVVAIGGFVLAQNVGMIGRAGRLLSWAGVGAERAERVDGALRGFYRFERRALLLSVASHFASWLTGALEALVILRSLDLPATVATAIVVEALGSGVRFATFFVPASLGPLEGANSAVFAALGWTGGAGLAFTLIRRARQAVWIGLGIVLLVAMSASRYVVRPAPAVSPAVE